MAVTKVALLVVPLGLAVGYHCSGTSRKDLRHKGQIQDLYELDVRKGAELSSVPDGDFLPLWHKRGYLRQVGAETYLSP